MILVFDTDIDYTEHLKKNIELLKKRCAGVKVVTLAQVLNFEDEIKRCTDVNRAQELTRSQSLRDFKSAVNKMKDSELIKKKESVFNLLWTCTVRIFHLKTSMRIFAYTRSRLMNRISFWMVQLVFLGFGASFTMLLCIGSSV